MKLVSNTKNTMYNKLNLDIGNIASKKSFKPELESIAFFGDKTVATDSYRLIEVSTLGDKLPKPVLLNAKQLKNNLKVGAKQSFELEEIIQRSGVTPTDADYPDYGVIMEPALSREDDIKLVLNGKMLAEILTLAASLSKVSRVELSIPVGKNLPIVIKSGSKEQTLTGLLMPMLR